MADIGIDPPTLTLEQTQATSPNVPAGVNNGGLAVFTEDGGISNLRRNPETGELYDPGGPAGYAVAPIDPGVGAKEDNPQAAAQIPVGTTNSGTTVSGTLNANAANEQIIPQDNVLDKFSSYTYRASLYLVTPDQYKALLLNKKKNVSGYQLLIQSGGAPVNSGGFQGPPTDAQTFYENNGAASSTVPHPGPDAGRSPAFPNDFYFESIIIENLFPGRGTNMAHAACNIKFTIVEPMGITLIDRLYQAVQDFIPKNGAPAVNYNSVTYLMVIRFYGYDSKGNQILKIGKPDSSDPDAIIEKFIPFRITKLDWAVQGKAVVYEFEGKPVGLMVGAGTRRGTIPYDIQPTARTVGELLGADAVYSDTVVTQDNPGANSNASADLNNAGNVGNGAPPPPKASAAATTNPSVKSGVLGAMNNFQQELIKGKNKIFKEPDTYKIVWVADKDGKQPIRDAKITWPGLVQDATQTGMAPAPTNNVKSATPERVAKDITSRNFSITAGMQIVQVIDLAIRNSSYILDQALTIRDDETGLEKENPQKKDQPVNWYIIEFEAKPKNYDELRSDTAFDVTFYIKPFTLQSYNSKYFPMTKFRGVHKRYQYWFTGQNTAVLDYKETLNSLYNITVTGSNPDFSLAEKQRRALTSSMREIPFYAYQASSTESRQGSRGVGYEESANLAEDLYSPSDLARTELKIIGDPAWLQQGQFAGGIDTTSLAYSAFAPDGTINFDSGQVLFEIAWQRPQDYDLATGLADPYSNRQNKSREPGQSRVYIATKCTSEFSNGKFTQTINGNLFIFLKPNKDNKAVTASVPTTATQADARRIDNAIDAQTATGQQSQPAASRAPVGNNDGDAAGSPTGGSSGASAATTGNDNPKMVTPPSEPRPSNNENNVPQQSVPTQTAEPAEPPAPPTSNGDVAGLTDFLPPPPSNGLGDAAPSDPQLLARDE